MTRLLALRPLFYDQRRASGETFDADPDSALTLLALGWAKVVPTPTLNELTPPGRPLAIGEDLGSPPTPTPKRGRKPKRRTDA